MTEHEAIAFYNPKKGFQWAQPTKITSPTVVDVEPLRLYTQRTWVGLKDEEWLSLGCRSIEEVRIGLAIQAKLKEKNT